MFWNLFLKMKVHVCHFSVKGNLSNLLQSISKKKTDKRRKYSEQLSRIAPKSEKTSPKNKTKRPAWRYVKVLLIWFFSHESTLSEFSIYSSLKKKNVVLFANKKSFELVTFVLTKKKREVLLYFYSKKSVEVLFLYKLEYMLFVFTPAFLCPKKQKIFRSRDNMMES